MSRNVNSLKHITTFCLCFRHQRAVNIVRWSPDGQLLASGDDESIIIIWKVDLWKDSQLWTCWFQMKEGKGSGGTLFDDGAENNAENWTVYQMIRYKVWILSFFWCMDHLLYVKFRSHLDDIYDLAWSPCSNYLLSGRYFYLIRIWSLDNLTLYVFNLFHLQCWQHCHCHPSAQEQEGEKLKASENIFHNSSVEVSLSYKNWTFKEI